MRRVHRQLHRRLRVFDRLPVCHSSAVRGWAVLPCRIDVVQQLLPGHVLRSHCPVVVSLLLRPYRQLLSAWVVICHWRSVSAWTMGSRRRVGLCRLYVTKCLYWAVTVRNEQLVLGYDCVGVDGWLLFNGMGRRCCRCQQAPLVDLANRTVDPTTRVTVTVPRGMCAPREPVACPP